jgi:hypothetical protein
MRDSDRDRMNEYHPIPSFVRESQPANVPRHRRKDRRWLAVLLIGVILLCLSGSVIAALQMA